MVFRVFVVAFGAAVLSLLSFSMPGAAEKVSDATQECLGCHNSVTPAIVADWKKGLHAHVSPAEALKRPKPKRRISAKKIPDRLANVVVGCAECHTLNSKMHKDVFDHSDNQVHVTVTPQDCAVCHPDEREQYKKNLMSHAWGNLANNPLYGSLEKAINGLQSLKGTKTTLAEPDPQPGDRATHERLHVGIRFGGLHVVDRADGLGPHDAKPFADTETHSRIRIAHVGDEDLQPRLRIGVDLALRCHTF